MMPAMTPPTPPAANTIPPAAHDVEAALPGMVRWTRAAAVGSLLGLIVLGLAWELVLAPTGNRTLVIKVLPLAIPLIAELRALYPGAKLHAYDPAVPAGDVRSLGVEPCTTPEEAFRDAAFVIYQNNNAAFSRLNLGALSRLMQQDGVIYDMWNQYLDERSQLRSDIAYFGLGTRLLAPQRAAATRSAANDG
jgi:hypothetical protein